MAKNEDSQMAIDMLKDPSFVQVTLPRIIPPKGTTFFQVRFWVDS